MTRSMTAFLTTLSLLWVACLYGFTLLPDDAPLWRGSPVGLVILALLLLVGALIAHAWHALDLPMAPPSSMADQAPGIRARRLLDSLDAHRATCFTCIDAPPSRDWH